MEDRGLVRLEARTREGEVVGNIVGVLTDDAQEVTHVLVESGNEQVEVRVSDLDLDPEADFSAFHADASDVEPGDHVGDMEEPEGYAPSRGTGDAPHEGQLVGVPEDEVEAAGNGQPDEARDFQDESFTPTDSGYPRNDAYIDADTGEERERYPSGEDLRSDVETTLDGTGLGVREVVEGVVGLRGRIGGQEDFEAVLSEIRDIEGVLDVDTTDVEVG